MARRPSPIPSIKLTTMIPQDIHTRMSLHLFSDLEGRIPPGAWQSFICSRIREYFEDQRLDLGALVGALPGEFSVHGSPAAIELLRKTLKGAS